MLRSLRPVASVNTLQPHATDFLPPEAKIRKRGKKGGVRIRAKNRPHRPYLPEIVTGNARSLNNKIDELQACARYYKEYRNASLICVSETWFQETASTSSLDIDNFFLMRSDRTESSNKTKGGGVCVYVNERWCHKNNAHGKTRLCTENIELFSVVLRPYYLPREFPKITVNIVYVPPHANVSIAASTIADTVLEQQTASPDGVIIITGDFNSCTTLTNLLPNFHQYVDVPTRENKTIDLCYCNVPTAYRSKSLPSLGESDHLMTSLVPTYRPKIKTVKSCKTNVSIWNDDVCERLRDCFECTDWSVFTDSCIGINELTETVTDYINFCTDTVVQKKKITCFSNNKPWVTKELKVLLNEKKKALQTKNKDEIRNVQKMLAKKIKACKDTYKQKLEKDFSQNNFRTTWSRLKSIVGYTPKQTSVVNENGKKYVNDLNAFYCRFDTRDFSRSVCNLKEMCLNDQSSEEQFVVSESEVQHLFSGLNVNKSSGPDNIKAKVLKTAHRELAGIFTTIFNMSLQLHTIPYIWKLCKVIPVPKKDQVYELNDLRPVALTSIAMKCFERMILSRLMPFIEPFQDVNQFAYQKLRSVEDAIVYFLDNVYRHLDVPNNYVRALFVDFSSAFNTIQPHLLTEKLMNMNVNRSLVLWILDFLTERSQFVSMKINDDMYTSNIVVTNTGCPQGCVLSPSLFTIYTSDCKSTSESVPIIKFADDTSIQGLIVKNDEEEYRKSVDSFVNWCENHFLLLNVKKTKEIIFDFRTKKPVHHPLKIKNEQVEIVNSYKYLGILLDSKLEWHFHSSNVLSKVNKRMYFVRKLKMFGIDKTLINLFYKATVESIICFCLIAWGGNTGEKDKSKLNRTIKNANKITSVDNPFFDNLVSFLCKKKLKAIREDPTHPLFQQIRVSIRSNRLIFPKMKRERYRRSFLPTAVRVMSI